MRFVYGVNPGQAQSWCTTFQIMAESVFAKSDETYSIERLDVGLVNEGSSPKKKGRV